MSIKEIGNKIKNWFMSHIRAVLIVAIVLTLSVSLLIIAAFRPREVTMEEVIADMPYNLSEIPISADAGTIVIDTAGQYMNLAEDAARIDVDGVTLSNSQIQTLEIGEAVGEGTVNLQNNTVSTLIINGGGQDSVYLNGGEYDYVVSSDEDCHIVIGTGVKVKKLYVLDSSLIDVFGEISEAVIYPTTFIGAIGWETGFFTFEDAVVGKLAVSASSEGYMISMQEDTISELCTYNSDDIKNTTDDVSMLAIERVSADGQAEADQDGESTATTNNNASRRQAASRAENERAEQAENVATQTATASAPVYIPPSNPTPAQEQAQSQEETNDTSSQGNTTASSGGHSNTSASTSSGGNNGGSTGGGNSGTGGGQTSDPGNTGGDAGNTGGDAGNTGGDAGNTGGDAGNTGGDAGNTGGDAGNIGGDAGNTGGDAGNTGGDAGNTGGDAGNAGGDAGNTGGDAGNTGGDAGNTGGDAGNTGGDAGNTGGDAGNTGGDQGGGGEPPAPTDPGAGNE